MQKPEAVVDSYILIPPFSWNLELLISLSWDNEARFVMILKKQKSIFPKIMR